MNVFILEDSGGRIGRFSDFFVMEEMIVTNSAKVGSSLIKSGQFVPDLFLLDHDLSGRIYEEFCETNTGSNFCREICQGDYSNLIKIPVIIHSQNFEGANNMALILKDNGFERVIKAPFSRDIFPELAEFLEAR